MVDRYLGGGGQPSAAARRSTSSSLVHAPTEIRSQGVPGM
jgi:hypothetical protein